MRRMPGWMPSLLRQINWACENSAIFESDSSSDTIENFQLGRACCRQLWHFIQELPQNIASVRDALPENMDAARLLLSELADDERVYQKLFIKQCQIARLNPEELAVETPSPSTLHLCNVMRQYCQSQNYQDGILAIVTAELAATAFCRSALPLFEKYFDLYGDSYAPEEVEQGLEWLFLHTKPHTKHALWLKRMLGDLEQHKTDKLPVPVEAVLHAVCAFLKCPAPGSSASEFSALESSASVSSALEPSASEPSALESSALEPSASQSSALEPSAAESSIPGPVAPESCKATKDLSLVQNKRG